jgi:hypothetical protein
MSRTRQTRAGSTNLVFTAFGSVVRSQPIRIETPRARDDVAKRVSANSFDENAKVSAIEEDIFEFSPVNRSLLNDPIQEASANFSVKGKPFIPILSTSSTTLEDIKKSVVESPQEEDRDIFSVLPAKAKSSSKESEHIFRASTPAADFLEYNSRAHGHKLRQKLMHRLKRPPIKICESSEVYGDIFKFSPSR